MNQAQALKLARKVGEDFLKNAGTLCESAKPAARRVEALLADAAELRLQSELETNPHLKASYLQGSETNLRAAKTIALAEGVVASDATAAWLESAARMVLATTVTLVKASL